MNRETFHPETSGKEYKSDNKPKKQAAAVVGGIIFLGILSGLIAVAVLYSQEQTTTSELRVKNEELLQLVSGKPGSDPTGATTKTDAPSVSPPSGPTLPPGQTTQPTIPPVPVRGPVWRISKNVHVGHYKLDLHVHLPFDESEEKNERAFTTVGDVEIHLRPKGNATTEIQFHARTDSKKSSGYLKFEAKDVTLLKNDTKVEGIVVEFQPDQDIVIITTKDALEESADPNVYNYKIKIVYTGTISADNDNQGLYRSSYEINNVKRYVVASQFQPYKARRVFPCFDEPGFRSTFEISVAHDKRFTMVRSNGDSSIDTDNANKPPAVNGKEWVRTKFSKTPEMSSYLVAFLIANDDFSRQVNITTVANPLNKEFGVISRESLETTASFALEQGVAMTEYLSSEVYGQPLYEHLDKIDMVSVPDFNSGAMENWGLIIYRESRMLYDEKINTANDKMNVALVVGHELAHFLFGNLLTCEFWDDTWLNEGFARFFQHELDTLFPYWVTQSAFRLDSYDTAHPLYDNSVRTLEEIDNMFDTTTYAKGGALLQMIKGIMGEEKFNKAIKNYLKENKLGNVKHAQLLAEFVRESGEKLEMNILPWIKESGYPVLSLKKEGDTITFKQSRFLFSFNETMEKQWAIPLTLKTKAANKPDFATKGCWLETKNGDLKTLCPNAEIPAIVASTDYYLANVDQTGYYRVDYDLENLNRIATALHEGAPAYGGLNSIARSQILDDAFNLAKADRFTMNYNIALGLTKYLSEEGQYTPFATAMDALRFIDQMLWSLPEARDKMRNYMGTCVLEGYRPSTSWEQTFTDTASSSNYDQVMFRSNLVESACYYEEPRCITKAQALLTTWNNTGGFASTQAGSNNYLNTMLCYGVRGTDPINVANWNTLREMLTPELATVNKLLLLRGLSCSQESEHLTEVLELLYDPKYIRSQDMDAVISYVSKFPEGLELAWNFVQINWDNLQRRSGMISTFGSKFHTPQQLKEFKRFYARRTDAGGAFPEKIAFQKAIAEVEANADWVRKHQKTVIDFFEKTVACERTPFV